MKIRLVIAELFQADKWTDMMKLTVAFYDFANAPNKSILSYRCTFHSIQIMVTAVIKGNLLQGS
jgi:hypothetical protein